MATTRTVRPGKVQEIVSDIGNVNDTTTDTLMGKVGTDTEMADSSLFDLLGGAGLKTDSLHNILMGTAGIATFPSAAAPANAVSLAEAIREIYDQQEKVAVKAAAVIVTADTLFTIANGPIQIIELYSLCITTNDGTASTLQYNSAPTVGTAQTLSAASASLASFAQGGSVTMNQTSLATAPDLVVEGSGGVPIGAEKANKMIVNAGTITAIVGVGSTTGTWTHHLRYKPLARGVTVT